MCDNWTNPLHMCSIQLRNMLSKRCVHRPLEGQSASRRLTRQKTSGERQRLRRIKARDLWTAFGSPKAEEKGKRAFAHHVVFIAWAERSRHNCQVLLARGICISYEYVDTAAPIHANITRLMTCSCLGLTSRQAQASLHTLISGPIGD